MLRPVRTAAPAVLLDVADAVRHCRVDGSDSDTVATITALCLAATDHLDGYAGILGRALVTQTWTQAFDAFGCKLRLPLDPVSSATVAYYDASNVSQTLATSVYQLLTDELGPFITLKPDQDWPSTYDREDAVTVTFVCGYGAASAVPQAIKHAALLLVSHWNENREAAASDAPTELPLAVDRLLSPYRRIGF